MSVTCCVFKGVCMTWATQQSFNFAAETSPWVYDLLLKGKYNAEIVVRTRNARRAFVTVQTRLAVQYGGNWNTNNPERNDYFKINQWINTKFSAKLKFHDTDHTRVVIFFWHAQVCVCDWCKCLVCRARVENERGHKLPVTLHKHTPELVTMTFWEVNLGSSHPQIWCLEVIAIIYHVQVICCSCWFH